MDKATVEAYRHLKNSGVNLQKHNQIRLNSGSESIKHLICKTLTAYIGHLNGYRVSSEVEVPNGDIDIVLWGHPRRMSYAVEIENNPKEDVLDDKLKRYVYQTNIDDIIIINPENALENGADGVEYIADELGLEYE